MTNVNSKGEQKLISLLVLALCVLVVAISFVYLYKYTDVFEKDKTETSQENNELAEINLSVQLEEAEGENVLGETEIDENIELGEAEELAYEKSEAELKEEEFIENDKKIILEKEKIAEKIETKSNEIIASFTKEKEIIEDLCNEGPKPLETGKIVYPVEEKYSHLIYLGQVFTAVKCGEERLSDLWGVSDENYTIGSKIELNSNPSKDLIETFSLLKYSCEDSENLDQCMIWSRSGDISTKSLLLLEPFVDKIKKDDCINCR